MADQNRAKWDALNAKQALLYLKAGRKVDPEQQKILDEMKPITPPGYGGWNPVTNQSS